MFHVERKSRWGFTIAALLFVISLPAARAEVVGRSIATINGEAIYLSEYQANLKTLMDQQPKAGADNEGAAEWKAKGKKLLLDQMIEEKLLLQEAKRKKVVVPKRQLEEGILQVKNRFKSLPPGSTPSKEDYERPLTSQEQVEFDKELKSQNLSEKEFEAKIEDQLRVLRLSEEQLRGDIASPFKDSKNGDDTQRELTPEYEKQARELYAQLEKKYEDKNFKPDPENEIDQMVELLKSRLGEAVHARHILVRSSRTDDLKSRQAALAKIKDIKKQLDNGADFIELANKNADATGKKGGDLGFFTRGQMVPEFEKSAFSLPVGGVSDIIETEFGYHILMVEEKRAAKRLRFDDVKMDLASYLYQKKMRERYEQYVADLKKKADIKILIDVDKVDQKG